jgi:hypothetical protein
MELPDPTSKGTLLHPVRSPNRSAELEIARPGKTIDDPGQPHCGDHGYFHADCETCKRACANFQPYPVRKGLPALRSFGFNDDLTEEKVRALDPKVRNFYSDDPDFSLSLSVLRFLGKLIWPF